MRTSTSRRRQNHTASAICRTCKESFPSRNILFEHLNKTLHFLRTAILPPLRRIVASKASSRKVGTGHAYKDFNYCQFRYQLSPTTDESSGCADTGSGMSLVDESVLESDSQLRSKARIVKSPVHIKGVGDELFLSQESVVLDIFLPDVSNSRFAKITREFHIVRDMACGLLIGNDIIEPEDIVLNLAKRKMYIGSCSSMACSLRVRRKGPQISNHVVIRCARATVIPTGVQRETPRVSIRFPALEQKEYSVKLYPDESGLPKGVVLCLTEISGNTKECCIYNFSGKDVHIPKDYKLGYIELPESPQYTALSTKENLEYASKKNASQCHFLTPAAIISESQVQNLSTDNIAEVNIAAVTPSQSDTKITFDPLSITPLFPKVIKSPAIPFISLLPSFQIHYTLSFSFLSILSLGLRITFILAADIFYSMQTFLNVDFLPRPSAAFVCEGLWRNCRFK